MSDDASTLKVGDTIWFFDVNRRVYAKASSGPIWREHWRPMEIVDETPRSWVVGHWKKKIPKKGPLPRGWCASELDIDREAWAQEHKHRIARQIDRLDAYTLVAVARAIGYDTSGFPE